jgi:hypothetical protein
MIQLVDLTSLWQVVRPESMESGPIKRPGGRFKHRAQRPRTYKVRCTSKLHLCVCTSVMNMSCQGKLEQINKASSFHLSTYNASEILAHPQLRYLLSSATYIIKFVALLWSVVLQRKKIWPSSNSAKSDNDDNYVPMVRSYMKYIELEWITCPYIMLFSFKKILP